MSIGVAIIGAGDCYKFYGSYHTDHKLMSLLVGIFAREEHIVSTFPQKTFPPKQILTTTARRRSFEGSGSQSHLFSLVQVR